MGFGRGIRSSLCRNFLSGGYYGVEMASRDKCGSRPRESNTICLMVIMVERNQVLVNECSCRDSRDFKSCLSCN